MSKKKIKIESINIGLASPSRIKKWAERILPNGKKIGEVTSSQTVNYKTLKPEKDGLFCERIFGPVKDFECACGTKKTKPHQQFCSNCDVEFTASRIRRYRLGYIELQSPVTHIWYLKGRPSYLSLLLDMSRKQIESIAYYTAILHVPVIEFVKKNDVNSTKKFEIQYDSQVIKEDTNKQIRSNLNNKIKHKKNTRNSDKQIVLTKPSKAYFTSLSKKMTGFSSKTTLEKNLPVAPVNLVAPFNKEKLSGEQKLLKKYVSNFQLNTLNQYYINKLKKKFDKPKLFKSNLNYLLSNTYYENSQIVQFDLLRNSNAFENIFIEFSVASVALQRKRFGRTSPQVGQRKEKQQNKKLIKSNSLFSVPLVALQRKGRRNEHDKRNFKKNKLNLITSKLYLNESVANNIARIYVSDGKSNLVNLKNKKLLSPGSQNFVTFTSHTQPVFSSSLQMSDKSKTVKLKKIDIPGEINTYYPLSSLCVWEQPEVGDRKEWIVFLYYLTSTPVKEDILIPLYSNRLEKMYEENTNSNYKSKKIILNGTQAISALLKTLHLGNLKIHLQYKIQTLDLQIIKIERKKFLYEFEVKTLEKLIKLRLLTIRRFKLVRYFLQANLRPEWMLLWILPVLPPDLRPIIQLDGNQVAVSDLNKFYQRILFRNTRIKRYRAQNCSNNSKEMKYAQRLLQEAVDSLIENGKGGTPPVSASNDRALKSLSDILKGKKGRFRQNLLGKRVDYSGRSVIVVAPELKLHECGLPKEMAIELFQPFLIRELRKNNVATTIIKAKQLMQKQDPIIWTILRHILKGHPILLNRAPTLHRLGIQAFQPKLVNGKAILLHPLVCPAFNADFDGDQMAVHVPLSVKARAEAWKLMWSRNNILSPATGQPIIVPSQDMVLGCYYLTTTILSTNLFRKKKLPRWNEIVNNLVSPVNFNRDRKKLTEPKSLLNKWEKNTSYNLSLFQHYFSNLDDVLIAFQQKKISLHSLIWVRWKNKIEIENFSEKPVQLRIDCYGNSTQIYSMYWRNLNKQDNQISQFIRTTAGRVILNKAVLQHITF